MTSFWKPTRKPWFAKNDDSPLGKKKTFYHGTTVSAARGIMQSKKIDGALTPDKEWATNYARMHATLPPKGRGALVTVRSDRKLGTLHAKDLDLRNEEVSIKGLRFPVEDVESSRKADKHISKYHQPEEFEIDEGGK